MCIDASEDIIAEGELINEASKLLFRLKQNMENHSWWLRRSSHLDLVIGGHLRRATMALESTILLAKAGAAYDAAATARIILEHALSAASISFADDPEREAYLFITRQWRHIRESDKKLREHYPELDPPNDETAARIQVLIDQTDSGWTTGRLMDIVTKLDAKNPSGKRLFSWFFDVPYSALSNYVHARALGLRGIVPSLGEPFHFRVEVDQSFTVNAVRQGMIGYLAMMIAVQQAWGDASLENTVFVPLEEFVRRAGPADKVGVYSF